MKPPVDLPFQIQNLIQQMLNKNDDVYIRINYKNRLDQIQEEIASAIKKYDNELFLARTSNKKKRK